MKNVKSNSKRGLLAVMVLVTLFLFVACGGTPDAPSQNADADGGYTPTINDVYVMAQEAGYEGTLEELVALFKGEAGAKGNDGVGITAATVSADGELVLTLSNGQVISCGVVSRAGADGADGVGISNIVINENGRLIVTLTDGNVLDCGELPGTGEVEPESHTVTFVCEGSELEVLTVTHGECAELPIPEREGYSFVGWYYGIADGANSARVTNLTPIVCDITLTAVWHSHTDALGGIFGGANGVCDECGAPVCSHTYSENWTGLEDGHFKELLCDCELMTHVASHADLIGGDADGRDGLCDDCGYRLCTHTYSREWSFDNMRHWHEPNCGCSVPETDVELHTDEDDDGLCDICGEIASTLDMVSPLLTGSLSFDDITQGEAYFAQGEIQLENLQNGKYLFTSSNEFARFSLAYDENGEGYESNIELLFGAGDGSVTVFYRLAYSEAPEQVTADYSVLPISFELAYDIGRATLVADRVYTVGYTPDHTGYYHITADGSYLWNGKSNAAFVFYGKADEPVSFTLAQEGEDGGTVEWSITPLGIQDIESGTNSIDLGTKSTPVALKYTALHSGTYLFVSDVSEVRFGLPLGGVVEWVEQLSAIPLEAGDSALLFVIGAENTELTAATAVEIGRTELSVDENEAVTLAFVPELGGKYNISAPGASIISVNGEEVELSDGAVDVELLRGKVAIIVLSEIRGTKLTLDIEYIFPSLTLGENVIEVAESDVSAPLAYEFFASKTAKYTFILSGLGVTAEESQGDFAIEGGDRASVVLRGGESIHVYVNSLLPGQCSLEVISEELSSLFLDESKEFSAAELIDGEYLIFVPEIDGKYVISHGDGLTVCTEPTSASEQGRIEVELSAGEELLIFVRTSDSGGGCSIEISAVGDTPVTVDTLHFEIDETHAYFYGYTYTAKTAGVYIFTLPIGVGLQSADSKNDVLDPEVSCDSNVAGAAVTVALSEGEAYTFYLAASAVGTYEITVSCVQL